MRCLHKRLGQSMVELSLVVLAVIAGIVVGGPYLLDSLNSQFKLWDTAVADSNNDRLIKAHANEIDTSNLGSCAPSGAKLPGSCGTRDCGNDVTLRYYVQPYSPVGCRTGFTCEPDPKCCSVPIKTQICWRVGERDKKWALPEDIPAYLTAQGFHSCGADGMLCKNGDRLYQFSCGTKPDMFIALDDPDGTCMPICNWANLPTTATKCDGQGVPEAMPDTKNYPDLLLWNAVCSADPGACQAKCPEFTFPFQGECVCSCPANTVAVRNCAPNECYQGTCPNGYCSSYMVDACGPTTSYTWHWLKDEPGDVLNDDCPEKNPTGLPCETLYDTCNVQKADFWGFITSFICK